LFDINKEEIIKKIDLPPFAVEGVALDNDGNIWFSDDDGAVLRYKFKDL
jgi:sugar lactone lactonase YvrE